MLFSILLTINVGIGTYFVYWYLYLTKMFHMLSLILVLKQQFIKFSFIKLINGRSQTNWDEKSNLLLLQRHYQSQKVWVKFVENWQKSHKNIDIYYIGYTTIKNIDDCEYIYSVNPVYLRINHASGYIEKKWK